MSNPTKTQPMNRRRLSVLACTGAVLAVTLASGGAGSVSNDPVIRVEMDWRLNLNEPEQDLNAPQFHTVMSPFGNLSSHYIQITWNYREKPNYAPGGLQIQSWNGKQFVARKNFKTEAMSTTQESISWTQVLETNGTNLNFKIENGRSATWGRFSGSELSVSEQAAVANLNEFDPEVSVKNSVITYGANRVDRLTITEVRLYGPNGLLSSDRTRRVVFRSDQL